MSQRSYFVHATAAIDEPCEIDADTEIWHFSHGMKNTRTGTGCNIGQDVVVSPGCIVGNDVKVQNNISIYTGVEVEDNVFLCPSMVFTNVINPRAFVERKNVYWRTIVRRDASIGANATVLCGGTLGEYSLIGAGAAVTRDVPPYVTVVGNPARCKGWACRCGCTLAPSLYASQLRCAECEQAYEIEGAVLVPTGGEAQ